MITGGLFIGVTFGLLAGYFGGKVDSIIMRIGEVFASFPDILLVILLAATLRMRVLDWVRSIEDNTFLDGLVKSGIADYLIVSIKESVKSMKKLFLRLLFACKKLNIIN